MRVNKMKNATMGQSAGETAILEAAAQLFSQNGYATVSMRGVAEAAGVSKANIYHHFASKESLYQAILHSSAAELAELVDDLAESSGSFDSRIAEFSAAHLGHLIEKTQTSRLVLREAFSGDDEKSKMLMDQVFGAIFGRVVSIFRAGQEAGVLRPDLDPALCATLLMGADVFFFQASGILKYLPQAEFAKHPDQFSREMVDVMLHGMLNNESDTEVPG